MSFEESTCILKVLVGSRAHGLARPDSDYDYRSVYVVPTREILSLNSKHKSTQWIEAYKEKEEKDDSTGWEIGHFLSLATHCNPTILEVFAAPIIHSTPEGEELRALFDSVWNPQGVRDAFIGYGLNQRKKFLENKGKNSSKFAVAYLRTLYQAYVLLCDKRLKVSFENTPTLLRLLQGYRDGDFSPGLILDRCLFWQKEVEKAFETCKHEPNLTKVNQFLLKIRKDYW